MCVGVGEDSRHGHDESHLIHSMYNFKYRLACFTWNVCIIVGVYSTGFCSPRHGTPFQVVQAVDPHPGPQP